MTDVSVPMEPKTANALPAENSVEQFIQDIRSYPRLTQEQERELAKACASGDTEAIKTMVASNLRLVVSIAKEYESRKVPLLDLIQEGSIGLIAAAKKFDYTRDVRFSTYATKWIRQGVARCVMDHSDLIRIPHYTAERLQKILRAQTVLTQENGEAPSVEEIAAYCQMEPEKVSALLKLSPQTCSLDAPVGESGEDEFQDLLEDLNTPQPQEELVRQEMKNLLDKLLSMLTDRQQEILRLRYGIDGCEPCSLGEISKKLGISKERVRQIEQQAMDELKKKGADLGLEDFLSE